MIAVVVLAAVLVTAAFLTVAGSLIDVPEPPRRPVRQGAIRG